MYICGWEGSKLCSAAVVIALFPTRSHMLHNLVTAHDTHRVVPGSALLLGLVDGSLPAQEKIPHSHSQALCHCCQCSCRTISSQMARRGFSPSLLPNVVMAPTCMDPPALLMWKHSPHAASHLHRLPRNRWIQVSGLEGHLT